MPARTFSADKMPFNMDENMSILNPFPSRMSGPGLLNKLISGPATPGVALEYLDVDGKKTELSYSDLHRESDSLALRLARTRCQIAQDTPGIILIYMPQCPSLYISQLAILKSGAAFCPLVLDVPEERLKFILEDTSARILLTTTAMRSQLPRLDNVFIIAVDDGLSDSITGQYQQEPLEGGMICPEPSSLAYVMYTSGSTGLPKAVCLSHQAVTQSLLAHNRYIPTFSRFLQFASPTFDVSVFEIFFPWYRGSTLVCVERSQLLGDLPGTITALNIDAAELTPSVAASLIRTRASVPTLQLLLTIGEILNAQVVRQFGGSSDRPGILYGMYGPTEAAIHCTLQPQYAFDLPVGTIGVPLDTVSCFIIEPAKSAEIAGEIHILPIGELGELAVGGHQLADGYLNREEQTQAAFVNHPKFGNLYRTGDKARLLRNGKLECHGRISSGQVKLRGQRVELGEIEHAASKAEECHAVVASVTSGLLVLFCIADSSTVSSSGILSACQKWLPRYMIPSDIVLLDDFPYLPSGKVDRKKLESDYGSRLTQSTSAHTNMSAAAAKIALVIQDILGVSIDRQTDLSAAGLDSLKAIQVATELRGQGFDGIGALEILRAVTVLDLDDVAKSERTDDHAKDVSVDKWQSIKIDLRTSVEGDLELSQHGNIEEILPCTPLQDAMLVETARQPQAYCNSLRFSVSLEITPEQLREALFALAEKHISLRSGFRASESPHCSYTQIVWGSMHASQFSVVDEGKSEWSINDETMLLRPLHYQYKKLDAGAELLMQIHHALYDQWSIEIILEDLISILRREEVPRRPSFASFNEVFSHKKAEDQTSHIDFWQEYLSNFTFGHLPNLSPRVMPSAGLDILEHTIDVEIESLRQAATAHSCSPHVFFQAIYAVLLGSYMGVDDVTFGTVFSGRTLPLTDIENIVGPLLSTLPSRINLGEGRKFSDIMRRLQNDNREVMQHSTVSLAEIRNTCGMTPGEALFDSIFVWQDTARPSSQSSALIKLEEARDYLEFTLTLELRPTLHGVEVKATFQPNILPLPQVEIFLQQLDQLVQFVLANPDALMSELSSQCSTSILSIANPEPWLFTYETGLGSFVEKHAMESPDKLALVFAKDIQAQDAMTETLTYEQLNSQANQLANYLIAQGARPNELIGVCMEKSINLYVTILAIIKAGSGYLPLVPETPLARVRQILGDANVVLCMADTTTTSTIAGLSECHAIDVTNIDYSRRSISNPVVPFKPTNIAYAVFTSGTTGKPKGVLVTQENILSNLDVLSKIYPVEEESRLLQACNQAFDVSVFEIFFTWYTGMCLCSASKDVLFRNIEAAINVLNITHLSLTPTVAALLNPTHIPKVKFLVTAGEAVTRQVHSAWAGNGLYQGYGPSETTNICTVNAAVEADHVINNIGRPFENTSAFVLTPDPGFHVVPTGGLGELCFGGQQVFRGYQNMAELTRSRIIDHPKYGRIYRSGDLGRMLHDGTILIQGRTDDQRKLRGQRVELGEITSCLLQVQGVQDCAVEIVKIGNKESLLCFWIPRSNSKDPYAILPPSDSIRETIQSAFVHLADHLPVYMIPDFLVPVSAIPQTSQGKIDRRRLAIDGSALGVEDMSAYSQALDGNNETGELSETETLLRSALAEVLQVPLTSIGNSTSFFALGLDSVSAIRLATALRTRHGHNVDVSQILKRPSVSRLAASMDTNLETRPQQGSKASAINCDEIIDSSLRNDLIKQFHQRNQNVQHILPCTPLQEAMLSSGSALGESSYHNKTLFKVQGEVARLKECWETMMRRHGILRTTFVPTEYPQFPYLQVALSDCLLPWQEFGRIADISTTLCEVEHPREISSLDYSLPWSINIYTSGSSTYLLLDMHHALYDANALANLLREVEEIYRDRPLAEPISFKPFLDHMFSVNSDHANEYFDDQLRDFVPKPFDKLSNSNSGFGSISEDSNISSTVVEDFLVKHSTSMLSLVQAMWVKVLSTYQSHSDVCFGNVVSGRSVPVDGVDTLVAPCFNTIPVRIDTSRFSSNLSLIKVLHKANVGVLPYQLTPLRHIQRRISGSGRRLFESLVLLQQDSTTLDGNIWSLEGESGNMDFPCIVEFAPNHESYTLSLHFDRSYFDDGVVRNLHQACFSAFVSCIRYPSSDVSDFIDFDRNIIAGSLKPDRQLVETARETTLNEVDADDDEDWSLLELQIRSAYSAISRAPEENIRKSTTIYRLGLDSISAIQVANQLRKSGLEIQSSDVMESPSCSELASVVQSRAQSPTQQTFSVPTLDLDAFDERYRRLALDGQDIASGNVLAIRPCTPVQSGMLSQYAHSEGHLYFNHTFYALDSSISCEDLKDAWAKVLAQHEIMRTGFISTDEHENPFVMLTYGKFDINDLWLQTSSQNSIGDYASLEQKAFDSVKSKLHLPPWRWSLVEVDGSRCMQWSAHHAIFDAESLRSILSDLKTALGGSDLPTKDSINGALNHILSKSQSDPGGQQTFWSQELGGASVTRFPNLTPIRAAKPELLIVERVMDTQRSVMETHCRESGVTLQAVGQAAWARLLSAYTGETNVTFGVVLSGRTSPETADAVFPCITTLPVVSNTAVDDEKLLQDLISYNASVQKYQFTPLTDIQKYAGLASEALFDSLFAYQRPLSNDISEASWKVVHEKASVELAVSIEMESLPQDQLGLRLTVHTDQIPSEQGEIMLRQMEVLILQLLSIEETINASVLSITSPKEHALPTTFQFMHEMVEGSTNAYPERIAVEFVDSLDGQVSSRHWNYRQFDAEANKIAHFLVNSGVSPGDVVATSFDKCPEQSFAVLAILKAGCAFCAIDHTAPAARKAFILEDSSAKILLTTESIRSELEGSTSCIIIDLLNLDEKMTLPTSPVTIVDLSPSSVSYVLYTSGTTGTPKGCEITHENAVQLLVMFQRLFEGRWTEHSRWLQFASYHFDVSIVEQFWTWSVGMRLVCAPRDLILEDIMGFISTMQITHLDLTPSLGRLLDPAMVPSLHDGVFITGGESLKQDMIDTWGDIGCLFNFYGPTECTIGVTVFPCVPRVGKPSNIGWQFDNVGTYVLAPGSDTPVLRGAIGELCISGALVGKGYLNRVELTKNCFPYLEAYKERIYRTGDVVRILHDGSIDFLGRKDNQVKLRGQRLEIDEIEAVIKRCEDVQDTLCLVAKHPKQQKDQLICFIGVDGSRKQGTPEFCAAASAKQLVQSARTACEEHLPGYMVPTHFLPIRRIPLSVNNKVEEKLLRQLYADMSATDIQAYSVQADSRQTFSDGERKVAGVLAELLKLDVDDMTPASNIFTLGLNSISAIQLSRRLKASGFLNAQVAIVLKGSTISKLTKSLATSIDQSDNEVADARQNISACQHRHLGTVTRVLRCKPDEIEVIAPCTALQQGIISRSLASESSLYFNTFRYSAGGVDLAKLESAFNQALERTQILRTFFIETNDGYVQAVKKSGYLPWWTLEVFDLATVDSVFTKRKEKWRSYNTTHLTVPFEVVVIRAGSEVFLSVDMHHALYDGISFELMMNNVFKLYKFEEADFGKPFVDCLPFGPLRNVQGAKEFWLDHLSNIQPTLMSSLSDKESSQDTLCVASLKVLKQADELRRSLGVTIQALVQACWIVTLRKYHQGAVGTVVSGRSIDFDGIEKVIGPLFNTIPFYLRCEAGDSWQTLVQRCHGFNTAALIYQHTPLRDISKWCNRGRAGPLFDTLFVFQGASEPSSTDISILTPHEDNHFEADYPLSFEAEETASGELKITLAAKASICNASRARELIEEFHQFFLAMVQDSENDVGVSVGYMFEQPTNTRTEDTIDTVSLRREDFEWTSEAAILRSEMATLAGVDETEIDQATSIFEIGLDSVDAVKLSSRLKKKELALPVSTIMQSQTIAGMISTLTGTKKDHSSLNSGDEFEETKKKLSAYAQGRIESKTGIECVLPASPMQEALVSGMVRSSYSAYFNHDVLKISKSIDLVRLEDAWRTVIEISPILRTGFLEIDDAEMDITFAQIIHKFDASSPLKLQIVGLPAEDAITDYLNRISSDASSMPLSHPQLQITRVSTPGDDYLVLSIAHALYDGHSLSLLHQDVLQAYNGTLQRRPFYGDFLKRMSNDSDEDAIAFWRGLLTSAKINQLSEMSNTTVGEITTHRAEKTSQLSAQDLAVFCKQQGVTLQAVCQTAWALILAHTVKSLDVMFGVVLAGRDSELAEDIMFPMMNTVIMRSVLHGSRRQVLQSIQATISDISTYQHFPLRRIQAACQSKVQSPAATSDKHAFFDTLFTFQRRPDKPDTELQTLYESVNGASEVEYPVAVEAEVVADSLIWRVACKSTAYDAQGASELLDTLDHILQAIVSRPHDPTLTFQNQAVSICGLCCFQQRGKGNVGQTAEALQESVDVVEVWSDTEASIRQVTAKVTKTPLADISKNMPIQNLGVDSINAIKIAALLRQKSIRISVSDIIRAGSISQMVMVIKDERPNEAVKSTIDTSEKSIATLMTRKDFTAEKFGYQQQDVVQLLPATAGQAYMLGAWQATSGQLFFGEFQYKTAVPTSIARIEQAWQQVVSNNAVLRTVFVATEDTEMPFLQLILRETPVSFVNLDVEENDSIEMKQPFARMMARRAGDAYELTLKIHHALYDAVSLPLLIQSLGDHLQGSDKTQQPSDGFANFIAQSMNTAEKSACQKFWTGYLKDTENPQLDYIPSPSARHIETYDPSAMSDISNVESALRKHGVSLQAVFFAAFARAYSFSTDPTAEDVIIGIYLANRAHLEDLSSLAAPTLNLVPLRVRTPTRTSLVELAKQVQKDLQAIGSATNSSVGLWEIEAWTGVKIDTFVNFVKIPDSSDDRDATKIDAIVVNQQTDGKRTEKRSQISEATGRGFVLPSELRHEVMSTTYQRSLDIEAIVTDGTLGIGVFGWEDMMDLEQAEGLIDELKIEIEGALELGE